MALGFIREDAIIFTTLHRSFNKKAALNARTEIGPVYKIRENIRHTHTHTMLLIKIEVDLSS